MSVVVNCVVGPMLSASCTPKMACSAITHVLQNICFTLTVCRAGDVVGQQLHRASLVAGQQHQQHHAVMALLGWV
jgi:hypothetical protein